MGHDTPQTALDTLRMSLAARQQILAQLDRSQWNNNAERRAMRVAFAVPRVIVSMNHRHGGRSSYCVTPRNLAARGVAFIHGQYVHTDTPCLVVLPRLDQRWAQISGRILRCRHVKNLIHEVSVGFDEAIDLTQYVRLTPEQGERWEQEHALIRKEQRPPSDRPTQLIGQALIIDSFAADRALLAHLLRGQGLVVKEAATLQEAVPHLNNAINLVLVDLNLGNPADQQLVAELRKRGYQGAVIGLSADDVETDDLQALAQNLGCNSLLGKPLDQERLYQTTEELLMMGSQAGNVLRSTLADDSDMRPLVQQFVDQAHQLATSLRQAVADSNEPALLNYCRQLKGAGQSFGFGGVSLMAQQALAFMSETERDLELARRAIQELILMLERTST